MKVLLINGLVQKSMATLKFQPNRPQSDKELHARDSKSILLKKFLTTIVTKAT